MSRQNLAKNRTAGWSLRLGIVVALLVAGSATPVYADGQAGSDEPARPAAAEAQRPSAPSWPSPSSAAEAASTGPSAGPHSLEQRVGELKEQVFRAKARLSLLSERFLRSSAGGGRAVIVHQSQMGRLYQPVRIAYQLDGREIFSKSLESAGAGLEPGPGFDKSGELTVFAGDLKPGNHTLSVTVVYRGNGTRVFSYFNKYTYSANAAQNFRASDGGITRIRVVCREKGNPALTEVADRPLIDFQVEDGSGKAPAPSGEKNPAQEVSKAENDRGFDRATKPETSPSGRP